MITTVSQHLALVNSTPKTATFQLVPRYTPGSPAMVDLNTFLRVAEQELGSYKNCLNGIFGEEKQKLAESKGVANIAYCRWQKGKKVFRLDLLTGLTTEEPPHLNAQDVSRLKDLRNRKQFGEAHMSKSLILELEELEHRNEIHRDKY